ncbi:aldolase/citrate lyase family protein [uncultured Propionibacterium sp.]|uniref:HpcH/HpaI aldolase/citrate lyase family protein n=1 Tax=uncultured Propionibacterium sp. TaxID=218066 RepID=UPI0029313A41|nr:aldolase/citrate lyase family protein [uncultured Propionibacterium sp.]
MYVPATRPGYIEYALVVPVDAVVVDLEDAVPEDEKDSARDIASYLLRTHNAIENLVFRVNTAASGHMIPDLEALLPAGVRTIRLADPRDRGDVETAVKVVRQLRTRDVKIELMIENATALSSLPQLVDGFPEIHAVTFGGSDYLSDVGTTSTETLWEAKKQLVRTAELCGLPAYDTVFSDYRMKEPVFNDAHRAALIGFAGKSVIHPAQIPVTREAFQAAE